MSRRKKEEETHNLLTEMPAGATRDNGEEYIALENLPPPKQEEPGVKVITFGRGWFCGTITTR